MSVTDETPSLSESTSFWDVNGYSDTVKRVDHGHRLCEELMQMVQDRADLEKHYAKSLRAWTKKWHDKIDKGPEYASMEQSMHGLLKEADHLAEIHTTVKEQLVNEVVANLKQWKSDTYHKQVVGRQLKETKTIEEEFKKAQKPWAKRLHKVKAAKKDYHSACKLEKSALNQESNSRGDSSISGDALRKIQDRTEKCKKEVEKTKGTYQSALSDLNGYNAKYMEDMTEIFRKTQEMEDRRLCLFKEILFGIQKCLDLTNNDFGQIYQEQYNEIDKADHHYDLKWWSEYHGVDMSMAWPVFEEYTVELNPIHHKEKKYKGADAITLTSVQKNEHKPAQPQQSNNYYDNASSATPPPNSTTNPQDPFGDEFYDPGQGSASEGVPVRALFDYEGAEEDELSFKVGDMFMKLEDKDEQGWCKGQKDGRTGLYPDNYVEYINT